MFAGFAAGAGGGKEWQLCQFNLYAPSSSLGPVALSFEPPVAEIDSFIMIILESRVLWSQPSGRVFENGFFPFSRTCCHSWEGWVSPQNSWHCQLVPVDFVSGIFVGRVVMTYPEWNKTEKAQGAHLYSTTKGKVESVIYPKLFPFSLLSTSGTFNPCTGRHFFWVCSVKCFEPGECGKNLYLMEILGFTIYF